MNAAPLPTLRGVRCTLRPLAADDAAAIARHADDAAVAFNLFDGFPQPYTLEHARAWCGEQHRRPEFGHVFAIEVDGEAAGCISVVPQRGVHACNAVVGYWLGRTLWGRGIAGEALQLVTAWAWARLPQLTRLYAPIFARNLASQRVAAHAGYVREGVQPRSLLKAGEAIDAVQFACYRPEAGAP